MWSDGKRHWRFEADPSIIRASRHNQGVLRKTQRPYMSAAARRHRFTTDPRRELSFGERIRSIPNAFTQATKDETKVGLLLVAAALLALAWANSPFSGIYEAIANYEIGPASLHMHLPLNSWAADGILTIFFFVVGLELKTEFVTGALRDIREAALPMLAAFFGMVGPASVYLLTQVLTGSEAYHGWAIPAATDIAFAVALLGLFGKGLQPAARTFLLTLAVVDDLLAIIVIAVAYSTGLNFIALGCALLAIVLFGVLVQKRFMHWWALIPIAVIAWGFMHVSGVHATISGVAMGLLVPAARRRREPQWSHHLAEKLNPISAGIVVPIFAFFAAGVDIRSSGGIHETLVDPVALGVLFGLPIGKLLGIAGSVFILTKFTRLRLGAGVDQGDINAIALLAGIGFTVALLVAGLAFPEGSTHIPHAKLGVMLGTASAAIFGGYAVHRRAKLHARGPAAYARGTVR
ncbi:Na+/H+ antiporter NhaA [Gleimia hominis]|uniref:Na+/H+ antiporter NhaA n=1 Tax=Gleimia hominis TaxID=595468 RepID=UPI000C7F94D3|nr:Na+/H+ antiporter NhaA [Gleimia hominis]WIK63728.1 Na+/H+ antiporter NhaA [Gleimia hominis]